MVSSMAQGFTGPVLYKMAIEFMGRSDIECFLFFFSLVLSWVLSGPMVRTLGCFYVSGCCVMLIDLFPQWLLPLSSALLFWWSKRKTGSALRSPCHSTCPLVQHLKGFLICLSSSMQFHVQFITVVHSCLEKFRSMTCLIQLSLPLDQQLGAPL